LVWAATAAAAAAQQQTPLVSAAVFLWAKETDKQKKTQLTEGYGPDFETGRFLSLNNLEYDFGTHVTNSKKSSKVCALSGPSG